MGYFRFRRSFRVLPDLRLNLSKSGVSTSIGRCGAWFTVGPKGTRTTVGLLNTPGSSAWMPRRPRRRDLLFRYREGAAQPAKSRARCSICAEETGACRKSFQSLQTPQLASPRNQLSLAPPSARSTY
jgi:hypothetical protein